MGLLALAASVASHGGRRLELPCVFVGCHATVWVAAFHYRWSSLLVSEGPYLPNALWAHDPYHYCTQIHSGYSKITFG